MFIDYVKHHLHHPHPHHHRALLPAVASWYGPGLYGGALACGGTLEPGTVGVANLWLRCGTRIRICLARARARSCAGPIRTVPVIDRGPYVSGRDFDLTAATRNLIGMGDGVAAVRWRIAG